MKKTLLSCRLFGGYVATLASTTFAAGCFAAPVSTPVQSTTAAPVAATQNGATQNALAPLHRENKNAPETKLAGNGKALLPIVIATSASADVKKSAATLAEYLGKMSGAKFEVQTGDGQSGIVLGTAADFPALAVSKELNTNEPTRREEYSLRSHVKGVTLIGATPLAVEDGVSDLLHRLGYRRFFTGPEWEVVPKAQSFGIAVDVRERPDYFTRDIWYGFGSWPENKGDKVDWNARNRMRQGIEIRSGHSYDSIIKKDAAEFQNHPEYLTKPGSSKLCVSNPDLRKLVVKQALDYFAAKPGEDSISMEPSDGGGWETEGGCRDGEVYKSVTDRVVTLANEVAAAVNEKYPGKYVGIYAYYLHSPPPTVKVHPNVAVTIATAFIQGGFSFEQLLQGWRSQGARVIGVREYYDYWDISLGRPGFVGGGDTQRIRTSIPHFYGLGGRGMSAETNENWGAAGLSFYIASRLLWNTQEKPNEIVEDFLTKSFGPAKEPMRQFYQLIDKTNEPLWSQDLIGRMYRHLDAARKLTNDAGIGSRLDALVLYTRYCDMLLQWEKTEDKAAQKALGEQILRFTYRWRRNSMIHSYILWRHSYILGGVPKLRGGIKNHPYPPETFFNVAEGKNPWKETAPVTPEEISTMLQQGIAGNSVAPFERVNYSLDLVPGAPLGLKSGAPGSYGFVRFKHSFLVYADKAGAPLRFSVTSGQIEPRGNTTLSLYRVDDPALKNGQELPPADGQEDGEQGNTAGGALASVDVPNDRAAHSVELKAPERGIYRLLVNERGKGTQLIWPVGALVAIDSSATDQTMLRGQSEMYFYVPKGTKFVGGFGGGRSVVRDASGKAAATLPIKAETFAIPVPQGQDGKLWSVEKVSRFFLMTVPPYLSRRAEELLLPREVVEKDARK